VEIVGPEKEKEEPAAETEVFAGTVMGPGDKPLKKWPFKLFRDGTEIDKTSLSGGTSANATGEVWTFLDASTPDGE